MHLKKLFSAKILRMLALGLILLGSLILLLQNYYGSTELVAMGKIRPGDGKTVVMDVVASVPGKANTITVKLSSLLRKKILAQGEDAEFLAVVNRRGENLFFERIYLLTAPEEISLQDHAIPKAQTLAVGRRPELVEMIGLDIFGYLLQQPVWAKEKMPQANKVYCQEGIFTGVKEILEGGGSIYDLYLLDAETKVVALRKTGSPFLTFPEFLRYAAVVCYGLAVLAVAGALLAGNWPALAKWGRRIWDQVSRRGARSSS